MHELKPLRPYFQGQRSRAREVTVRPAQARDQTEVDRVTRREEDDRNRLGRRLCRQYRRSRWRDNHSHLASNEVGC